MITMGLVRSTQLADSEPTPEFKLPKRITWTAIEERDKFRHELLFHTVRAQEEERSRIARELHDETSQVLTALSLDLATLRKRINKNQRPKGWWTGYKGSANKCPRGSIASFTISPGTIR